MQDRDLPAWAFAAAAWLAVCLIGALEAAHLPAMYGAHPWLVTKIAARSLVGAGLYLAGPLLSLAALGWVLPRIVAPAARVAVSTLIVAAGWLHPWGWVRPYYSLPSEALWLAMGGSAFAVAATLAASRPSARLRWAVTLLGLGGFIFLHHLNHARYPRLYPHVHLVFFQVTVLVLASGLLVPVARALGSISPRSRLLLVAVPGLGALALQLGAAPHVRAQTILGRAQGILFPLTDLEPAASPPILAEDPDAERRFARESGLPPLPDAFRLADHDVLLIMIEALRWDATTLGGAPPNATPHLDALARDALVFEHALSPSTGTLPSSAAIHTMKPPMALRLETWQKAWHGALHDSEHTVAEVLAEAGHQTFWAGHDYRNVFETAMLGLGQGFQRIVRERTDSSGEETDLDARIARGALTALDEAARTPRPYFGWVFFVSPHSPYQARYPGRPAETPREKYQQEVSKSDEAVGEVTGWLRRTGRLERTVVILTSDHGEEFGERGGSHHKTSVHAELRHVPLIVRVPGMAGARHRAPVSIHHVLPWLLLRSEGAPRELARERLRREIGPLLRETGGAKVVELIGMDRMDAALVYPDRSVYLDLLADHASAFDLASDPGETRDVWLSDPSFYPELRGHVEGYHRARAALRRFSFAPTKTPQAAD